MITVKAKTGKVIEEVEDAMNDVLDNFDDFEDETEEAYFFFRLYKTESLSWTSESLAGSKTRWFWYEENSSDKSETS